MLESKLNLNFDLVEQARNHASKVADDTQRFIDRHTTVAVERTVCRLLGIDGVNSFEVPPTWCWSISPPRARWDRA